jgi:hypothetical protein
MKSTKTHISELYRVNVTYRQQHGGVYRVTFLLGRFLAPINTIYKTGIETVTDTLGVPRFYCGNWKSTSGAIELWMRKNRIA